MFFRIKKIKGNEYAYIVENKWENAAKSRNNNIGSKKGSRQYFKEYVGRIYRFDLKNDVNFLQFMNIKGFEGYINNNNKNKILSDLIELELHKFEIKKQEFSIDLVYATIKKEGKNVVFAINDGYMCNHTLKKLFEFKPEGDEQIDGYRLARAFVEAGIKVPQEIFIGIFGKLY